MGKRKLPGTKNVDKVPKLAKEEEEKANETRKHVTFDEDADIETPSTDLILDGKKKKDKKRKQQQVVVEVEEEEASPEEITADSVQVQQLKDLYEQSLLSTKKKNKKKKAVAKHVEQQQQEEEEEELDAALLDSLQTVQGDNEEEDNDKETTAEGERGSSSGKKTSFREEEDLTKSKTIGRVKIIALEEKKINPLEHFKLSSEIAAFEQKRREGGGEGVERVRYTTFIAQRRPGPAKRFLRS